MFRKSLSVLSRLSHKSIRSVSQLPPLTQPFFPLSSKTPESCPNSVYSPPIDSLGDCLAEVTTLQNQIKVISQNGSEDASALGIFVCGGSNFESPPFASLLDPADPERKNNFPQGVTKLIEQTAFQTGDDQSQELLNHQMQKLGGLFFCRAERDRICFVSDVITENIPNAFGILAKCVTEPTFNYNTVETGKMVLEHMSAHLQDEMDDYMKDLIHATAYQGGLSTPLYPLSPAAATPLTLEHCHNHFSRLFCGKRVIVAATACDHDLLVRTVESTLGHLPSAPPSTHPSLLEGPENSQYCGGFRLLHKQPPPPLSNTQLMQIIQSGGQPPKPFFNHLAVVFESIGWNDPEIYALCVLQTLMGGGSSFSSGGPGKGMFARLPTQVLTYGFMESANTLHTPYADTGLFGIHSSCAPGCVGEMIEVSCQALASMLFVSDSDEFRRAKKQLKSMLLMNLEHRLVRLEDLAVQLQMGGTHITPNTLCAAIDKIQPADLTRVARRILQSKPTVVCVGETDSAVPYEAIATFFQKILQS